METKSKAADVLDKQIGFQVPNGDDGVFKNVKIQEYRPDRNSYVGGEEISFTINLGPHMLSPSKSFFTFGLNVTGSSGVATTKFTVTTGSASELAAAIAGTTGLAFLPGGTQSLVERVWVESANGVPMDDTTQYNHLAYVNDMFTLSDDFINGAGSAELIPPRQRGTAPVQEGTAAGGAALLPSSLAVAGASSSYLGSGAALKRMYHQCNTAATDAAAPRVNLNLRHSPILSGERVIPSQMRQIRIVIKLAAAEEAFTIVRTSATESKTDLSGLRILEGARASDLTTADIGYRIVDPVYYATLIEPSSLLKQSFDEAVNGSGLPMPIESTYAITQKVPANNVGAFTSVTMTKAVANATKVMGWVTSDAVGKFRCLVNSFAPWNHGLQEYQFRFGGEYMPINPVKDTSTALRLTSQAAGLDYMDQKIPLWRYDPTMYNCGVTGATNISSDVGCLLGGWPQDLECWSIWDQFSANQSVFGMTLKSVKELGLSGLTVRTGSQLQLELKWRTTGFEGGTTGSYASNSHISYPGVLRLFMGFSKVGKLQNDGNYSFVE